MSEGESVQIFINPNPKNIIRQIEPLQNRDRTDTCCLVTGIILSILVIGTTVSFIFVKEANLMKLTYPSDEYGKVCGYDVVGKPFLTFTSLTDITKRKCDDHCPADSQLGQWVQAKICVPTSQSFQEKFKDKLQNYHFLLRDYTKYYKVLGAVVIFGLIIMWSLMSCPQSGAHAMMFLSLVGQILLGTIFYLYQSQSQLQKFVLIGVMTLIFMITLIQTIVSRQALKVSRLFMSEARTFISQNKILIFYSFLFTLILLLFLVMAYFLYLGAMSISDPVFDANHVYYKVTSLNFAVGVPLLVLYMLWGIYCIKEVFTFIVMTHVVVTIYGQELPEGMSKFGFALELMKKHLGSSFASAIVHLLFLMPATVHDTFRNCKLAKFEQVGCLGSIYELVRSDVVVQIILSGNSYCSGAKYCQYFWFQSMTTENNLSSLRIFKITLHMLVTTFATVGGLCVKGTIDGDFVYVTLFLGLILPTFFLGLQADVCEAIRYLYLMEEEGHKRRDECFKFINSVLNRTDQLRFIKEAEDYYRNKVLARELANIRKEFWMIKQQELQQTDQQQNEEVSIRKKLKLQRENKKKKKKEAEKEETKSKATKKSKIAESKLKESKVQDKKDRVIKFGSRLNHSKL